MPQSSLQTSRHPFSTLESQVLSRYPSALRRIIKCIPVQSRPAVPSSITLIPSPRSGSGVAGVAQDYLGLLWDIERFWGWGIPRTLPRLSQGWGSRPSDRRWFVSRVNLILVVWSRELVGGLCQCSHSVILRAVWNSLHLLPVGTYSCRQELYVKPVDSHGTAVSITKLKEK